MPYIDAVLVKGQTKGFSVSIQTDEEGNGIFTPLDLSDYAIRFRIMGSATLDGKVLVEHILTQNTDIETIGQIDDAANGQFTFVVNAEDQDVVGLGIHPISIEILDAASLEPDFTLTEGGLRGEFNKIHIVEV